MILKKIIEYSIILWIRSKCKGLKQIKVDINANNKDLINGKINGLRINAKELNFKEIYISEVALKVNKFNYMLDKNIINIKLLSDLIISSRIKLNENDIIRSIDQMRQEELIKLFWIDDTNNYKINSINIENQLIKITTKEFNKIKNKYFSIHVDNNKILLFNLKTLESVKIINDKNIKFRSISYDKETIFIKFNSKILSD
tara:strand:+ start:19367 stop:19969 length:603 start_codon:yes stop_codon:yes gene_type:complete